jgi:hypothetical protein
MLDFICKIVFRELRFYEKPCEPQLENYTTLMLQFSPRLRDELIIILRLAEMA